MSNNPPFKNVYHVRKVGDSSSKACFVCYKPTNTVLVTSDGKSDFFYLCEGHLVDKSFASPQIDPEVEAAKEKKKALEKEIEELEKKWKERESKKKKAKKDDDKEEDSSKDQEEKALKNEKDKNEEIVNKKPRVYILNNDIFSIRRSNWRSLQQSKKTQQLLNKPNLFPKVPSHVPSTNSNSDENEQ